MQRSSERPGRGRITDVPGISVAESGGSTIVSETGNTDDFSVVLDSEPGSDVVLNVASTDPGEATVSDMVKELIRPMLREWLDENLPGIVERVVRREIQKLVDRAEADD